MNEYYADKLNDGIEFEKFVYEVLKDIGLVVTKPYTTKKMQFKGENSIGWEIKYDQRMAETGNAYIEIAEKSDPKNDKYVNSGIYRDDNTWLWLIGNYTEIYIIQKNLLKMLVETGRYRQVENDRKTSIGYLIPKKVLKRYAGKVIIPR